MKKYIGNHLYFRNNSIIFERKNDMLKKNFEFVSEQQINLMYDCSTAINTLKQLDDERLKEAIAILNEKRDVIHNKLMGPINLLKDNLFHFFRIANLNSGESYYLMPYKYNLINEALFTITLYNTRYEHSLKEKVYTPGDFCGSDIFIEEIEYNYFMFQVGIGSSAPLFYRLKSENKKTKEEIGIKNMKQLDQILNLSKADQK